MTKTNAITNAILSMIHSIGGCAVRINTMGVYDKRTGKYRRGHPSAIGTADVIACIGGRYYEFEVKFGRDRQSDAQKAHEEKVAKAGGKYFVIRSTDNFLEIASIEGWIKNGVRKQSAA